jgi:hypothetical protein
MPPDSKFPPEPWLGFLTELDAEARHRVDLHCLGGFVVTHAYGFNRTTSDVDVIMFVPKTEASRLIGLGQKASALHRRYKVYLDPVTVVTPPEDYEKRMNEMFPSIFKNIRLFALDPYDIALTKIERNSPKDREDVKYLARTVPFDTDVLRERYHKELRDYLLVPEREDLTLKLWIEMIEEERARD